jgi:hypothetical protein
MYRRSGHSGLELSNSQVWLIGSGLFIANLLSLYSNLQRYLTGFGDNDIIEWWWADIPPVGTIFWFSPNYVWIVGAFAFGMFLVSLWKLRVELGLPGDSSGNNSIKENGETVAPGEKETPSRNKNSPMFRQQKPRL